MSPILELAHDGLWRRNQALVAMLGLCPLLALSTSLVNGLALGLATTAALVVSSGLISVFRHLILKEARLPLFVLIIASTVTAIDLAMNAWFHELHRSLGLFIPLIVTNCAILARAEMYASRNSLIMAVLDALFMGLGFLAVISLLGGLRELIGTGHLFAGAAQLLGPWAEHWTLRVTTDYEGFLLGLLPAGAFIGLGLLMALRNAVESSGKTPPRKRVVINPIPNTPDEGTR